MKITRAGFIKQFAAGVFASSMLWESLGRETLLSKPLATVYEARVWGVTKEMLEDGVWEGKGWEIHSFDPMKEAYSLVRIFTS